MKSRALRCALFSLGMAALACASPVASPPTPTPTLPAASTVIVTLPRRTPTATPLALVALDTRWYQVLYPQGWEASYGDTPDDLTFAPSDRPGYGIRVRLAGSGYTFSVLDALINSEVEAMRREGLAPQELGIRRPEAFATGGAAGRSAEFLGALEGTPVRIQVTAVVADFGAAYVLRLWAPQDAYEAAGYAQTYARAVSEFVPLFNPEPTPTTGPPTPVLALAAELYRSESFVVSYPSGWTPVTNADGSVNFLVADPELLVGIEVRELGSGHDPDRDPPALLDAYLDEVARLLPEAIPGEGRAEETLGQAMTGLSATYVVPYERGRLVYRVTVIVSHSTDGTAYRIVQWAPESLYDPAYRDLYRQVVASFAPLPAELPDVSAPASSPTALPPNIPPPETPEGAIP